MGRSGMAEAVLTVREVAQQVGATEQTIRRWLRLGRIHGVMPGGAKLGYRIPRAEVDRLLGLDTARQHDTL
jgi:excisionase family DNA binding protein